MHFCKSKFNLLIIVFLSIINFCYSQGINDTILIKEVVISERKASIITGIKVLKIDSISLQYNCLSDISSVFSDLSSVSVRSYGQGGSAVLSVRGTAASHTQLLWNNINVTDQNLGQADLSLIPTYIADEISLTLGGNTVAKTSGALGCVISIDNTADWNRKFGVDLFYGLGSFNSHNIYLATDMGGDTTHMKMRLYYKKSDNNFEYKNSAIIPSQNMKQKNAGFAQYGFTQEFYHKMKNSDLLSLQVWAGILNRNIPALMTNVEAGNQKEKEDNQNVSISGEWRRDKQNSSLSFKLGLLINEQKYFMAHQTIGGEVIAIDSKSLSNSFVIKLDYKYNLLKNLDFLTGIESTYNNSEYNDLKIDTGFVKKRKQVDVFAALNHKVTKKITTYFLARVQKFDYDKAALIPTIGMNIKVLHNISNIKMNLAKNYRYPSLNDLYFVPGGNKNLNPEKGYSGELGIDFIKKINSIEYKLDITTYAMLIEDWILWKPTSYGYWQPENIQKVYSRGLEVSSELNNKVGAFNLILKLNYSHTLSSDITNESEEQQLIYIPKNTGNGQFGIEWHGYQIFYKANYFGERYTTYEMNGSNYNSLPYYVLHDLLVSKTFTFSKTPISFNFEVDNLLNEEYQSVMWRAMPGRSFQLSIKIKI